MEVGQVSDDLKIALNLGGAWDDADDDRWEIPGYGPDPTEAAFQSAVKFLGSDNAMAWRAVEALAPGLAGPWELYDHRMARPVFARCTAFLADDTEARDHRAKADGWRLVE